MLDFMIGTTTIRTSRWIGFSSAICWIVAQLRLFCRLYCLFINEYTDRIDWIRSKIEFGVARKSSRCLIRIPLERANASVLAPDADFD
mmetsp:Transcript_14957/g.23205  ORF Transcript_14957/g.23205 Transcript_14957/m.23205 type:complete len:88 (+) Transcript_14957:67-330(+)